MHICAYFVLRNWYCRFRLLPLFVCVMKYCWMRNSDIFSSGSQLSLWFSNHFTRNSLFYLLLGSLTVFTYIPHFLSVFLCFWYSLCVVLGCFIFLNTVSLHLWGRLFLIIFHLCLQYLILNLWVMSLLLLVLDWVRVVILLSSLNYEGWGSLVIGGTVLL